MNLLGEFILDRWQDITFRAYQHTSLVLQSVLLALVIALIIGVLISSRHRATALANSLTSIGLTLPSLALLGLAIPLFGIGTIPSVVLVVFYAVLPILRNAIVGLQNIDPGIIESARGQGMSPAAVLLKVRLPLAWPVIMTGVRVSTQMSMGVAAIAAYALGPGLGSYIFTGLSQIGGANALNYAFVGTIGIVTIALVVDALLELLQKLTTSNGL
ncbi:Choline transporter, permease protein [Corynebacterium casei]|nr:Choline transporter, permease protein [Corynebacterium casei]